MPSREAGEESDSEASWGPRMKQEPTETRDSLIHPELDRRQHGTRVSAGDLNILFVDSSQRFKTLSVFRCVLPTGAKKAITVSR